MLWALFFGVLMSEGTKRKPAVFTLRACCSRQLEIGCLFDLYPGNRLTGKLPSPSRFPYCLHCKNAANSAPQKLIRISHSEPCSIQMMRIAVTQNVMAVSDFCDIALALFRGGANLSLAEGRWLGPRVNVKVDSGPFHIWPSGIPSDHQPKGTRA